MKYSFKYAYKLLYSYPNINYIVLDRGSKFQPFVAAWCYDANYDSWAQGHYFETLADALHYIRCKHGEQEQPIKEVEYN